MSVRHVYARDGEYIAVHRNHGGYVGSSCSSSTDDDGWLIVVGILFCVWVIYLLRYIILAAAILIALGWLIWKFYRQKKRKKR